MVLLAAPAASGVRVALDARAAGEAGDVAAIERQVGARLAVVQVRASDVDGGEAFARLRSAMAEAAPRARWAVVPDGDARSAADPVRRALVAIGG